MNDHFITLNKENIESEHICCAFSDKKCADSYVLKKEWLKNEFDNGYVFRRLDERAKVFIEYVPAENAWVPVTAPNYLMINCMWVSGQYKGQGYGKALLNSAIDDVKRQGKSGLVTVVGTKKFHFMGDTKWFIKQGFKTVDTLPNGFSLLALTLDKSSAAPQFNACTRGCTCPKANGIVVYYSARCPYTDFYINGSLKQLAAERNIPLTIIKIESMEQAQSVPSPATIFSAFYNGKFLTTDISMCVASKFGKYIEE